MSKLTKVSIIIPCFNEEKTLNQIIDLISKADTLNLEKEIIVIDDASTDKTPQIIRDRKDLFAAVTNEMNQGKGFSIREGLKRATGEIILIQDADLEYSPNDYPALLRPIINNEINIVYGARKRTPLNKSILTFIAKVCFTGLVNSLYSVSLTDLNTCYKVFKRDIIQKLPLKSNRFGFCSEVTTMAILEGENILEVPVHYNPRSKFQGKKIRLLDGFSIIFPILYNRLFYNKNSVKVERLDEI